MFSTPQKSIPVKLKKLKMTSVFFKKKMFLERVSKNRVCNLQPNKKNFRDLKFVKRKEKNKPNHYFST